jgi:hypothetical protein
LLFIRARARRLNLCFSELTKKLMLFSRLARASSDDPSNRKSSTGPAPRTNSAPFSGLIAIAVSIAG